MAKIYLKTFVIGVVVFVFTNNYSFSQVAINAAGAGGTGSDGSIEYSLGQIVYTTGNGSEGTVLEGAQIPFEIFVITALPEALDIVLYCTIYPNPTKGNLTLKIKNTENTMYSYALYNIAGKQLQVEFITMDETVIEMENLPAGMYFLKITENKKDIKTFRIIKN